MCESRGTGVQGVSEGNEGMSDISGSNNADCVVNSVSAILVFIS